VAQLEKIAQSGHTEAKKVTLALRCPIESEEERSECRFPEWGFSEANIFDKPKCETIFRFTTTTTTTEATYMSTMTISMGTVTIYYLPN